MWCNMDGISASRRRQKRQAFHSLPLNSRLNYWQMSFCLRNDALARRLYDLMLHRERLQLLHIIHCSVCGWLRQPQIYSGSRSLVTPISTLQQFSNGISIMKMLCKILVSYSFEKFEWMGLSGGLKRGASRKTQKIPEASPYAEGRSPKSCLASCVCWWVPKMSIQIKLSGDINI